MGSKRVNVKAILADADLRRKLMVSTIQATQAREGIETTLEQADRAYYVVSESERCSFFDLVRLVSKKSDRRHAGFVAALRVAGASVRKDVSRRDFDAIEGSPLAFNRVGLVAHIFREEPPLDPAWAIARQGKASGDDPRWVRHRWEVVPDKGWVPFAKGGEFSRFYADIDLVLDWKPEHREELKASGNALPSEEYYFKAGLTWPLAAAVFNVRLLPPGCVFGHKGPAIFPEDVRNTDYLLGILNSDVALCFGKTLTSRENMGGRWEVGVVKRFPIPRPDKSRSERIAAIAGEVHQAKMAWDKGNEISSHFDVPWACRSNGGCSLFGALLDGVADDEAQGEGQIRALVAELNNEVYRLYGIPDTTRQTIEETLGERPPEVLWPQMAGKSVDEKRMEHVWRLLSYAVKRVLEADDDGIVAFNAVNGEPRLVERVRQELATLFPGRDANQVEVEIVNELKRTVKGYRKCASLDEWLDNVFFEYHAGLYKNRPIFWHIASTQGTSRFAFGALVHYHRFDKNRMAKLRASYLRDAIEEFRREAGLADKAGRSDDRLEWQAKVEEAQALDKKLQLIQEGHHEGAEGGERDYRILTPWKEPGKRPKGWDPDLDDGVKVNIESFEKAGVLRMGKVT